MDDLELLAIISLPEENKVLCCYDSCGRPIYSKVHILRLKSQLLTVGSGCFKKAFKDKLPTKKTSPKYKQLAGNTLSPDDLALFQENTERLIEKYEEEFQKELLVQTINSKELQPVRLISELPSSSSQTTKLTDTNYPIPVIKKKASDYPSPDYVPKFLPIIDLALSAEEIQTLQEHQIRNICRKVIFKHFKEDRNQHPKSAEHTKNFEHQTDRLIQKILARKNQGI
jgi:hypothetical protein